MGQQEEQGFKARATPDESFRTRETEDEDVEGHGIGRAPEGFKARATEDEGYRARATEDEDVEGHSMLPIDVGSARHLANAREHEIRRQLERHELEAEGRRPHNKQTR